MEKIRFKKARLWLAYPVFLLYPFLARITDISFVIGVFLMLLGLGVRFWASGYISKTRVLATSGPYAHTRNPLYLGNFILGLGIVVTSNHIGLILYYLVTFAFLYRGTIRDEQKVLQEKFGPVFRDYVASVPVLWPSLRAYDKAEKKNFSLKQSFKNGEFIRICGFSLLILSIYLWWSFGFRKSPFGYGAKLAIFLFVVFFCLLWFNIYIRRKSERKA